MSQSPTLFKNKIKHYIRREIHNPIVLKV